MTRWLWGGGVLVGVVLAFVAVAEAGSGGERVVPISGSGRYAEMPAVAVDGQGDQTVAWADLSEQTGSAELRVMTAAWRVGGRRWSTPERLSGWAQSQSDGGPPLAVNQSGAGVIAWVETGPFGSGGRNVSVVKARIRRSASAGWGRAVIVGSTGVGGIVGLRAGIDHGGTVTAIWSPYGSTNPPIDYATAHVSTGRWERARVLAAQGGISDQLAVNERGDMLVSWQHELGSSDSPNSPPVGYLQMARYRPAGGTWRPVETLARFSQYPPSAGARVWGPTPQTIALDPHGGASVTWESSKQTVYVAHRSAHSRIWTRMRLSAGTANNPTIGTDARGELTVVWSNQSSRPIVTESKDGRHWSPPAGIPGVSGAPLVELLAVGQLGNAILTWNAPPHGVFVSIRPRATARWTQPVQIGRGYFPQPAIDKEGRATIAWLKSMPQNSPPIIYASTYATR